MKKLFALFLTLPFGQAWASVPTAPTAKPQFRIEVAIENNGAKSNAEVLAVEGESARIENLDSQGSPFKLEVCAAPTSGTEKSTTQLRLKFYTRGDSQAGKSPVSIDSLVLLKSNELVTVGAFDSSDGKSHFKISARASRITNSDTQTASLIPARGLDMNEPGGKLL